MRIANLKNLLAACVFLSVIVCPALGKIIYVDDDANGANDGTSWTDAYTDLQSALFFVTSGDQVWVATGTYKPGINRTDSFALKNGVSVYGGFAGIEDPCTFNPDERDFHTNETILSGDIKELFSDNCYHVFYHPDGTNLDTTAVLNGFTITGGQADGSGEHQYGGGMFNSNSSPTIINCTFIDNTANVGAGINNYDNSNPILTNCTINGNTARSYGGGMRNANYSSPTVINCIISDNTADVGAGMDNYDNSNPILTNCTIYGNTASLYGGGMYNDNSIPVVTNCILWANSSNEIWGTDPIVTYSNVQLGTGAPWFGIGCIDSDPTFVNAAGGDFHLQDISPCLDAGTNIAPSLPATDFEGDPRIINVAVDMGVDEVDEFTLTIDIYPQGAGSVILDPPGGSYPPGTVVQLTAAGDGSFTFDFWFGDLTGTANPQSLIMDSPKQITCYFDFTGNIIYVNDDANGFNNGGSWDNAFTDFQDALDLAVSGMEIWVATGTYKPREIPFGTGDRNKTFQMKNGVSIYGGFGGTEDPCNFNPDHRDFITNETILSGDLNGNDIPGDFGTNRDDNCYHVFYKGDNLDTTAVLDGFTITGGHADPDPYGGGMYNEYTSPTVRNCIFSSNYAYRGGGGMYNYESSPIVSQCTFSNNYCYYDANAAGGGGMYNYDSSPMLFNSIFSNNNASTNGGGMMNSFKSKPTVVNCVFLNNNAVNTGGGISNSVSSHPTIINCTFSGNTANLGGGIYISDSSITLTNCILWNDTPDEINSSYYISISVSYSDIQGMPYGSGCIVADPLFVNPASNDLHLQAGSPCIDAGNDLGIFTDAADLDGDGIPNEAVPVDLDGNSRYVDDPNVPDTGVYFISEFPIVDMGAYEHPGIEPIPGDINYDGVVDFKDVAILCNNWLAGTFLE